jgi:hypothetical protein
MKLFENPIIVDEMAKWNATPYAPSLSPQYEILSKSKPRLKLGDKTPSTPMDVVTDPKEGRLERYLELRHAPPTRGTAHHRFYLERAFHILAAAYAHPVGREHHCLYCFKWLGDPDRGRCPACGLSGS